MLSRIQSTSLLVLFVCLICLMASVEVSRAWVASTSLKSNANNNTPKTATKTIKVKQAPSGSTTAQFYQRSSDLNGEEAARAAAKAVASSKSSQRQTSDSLSTIRQLPWMQEEGPDAEEANNYFLDLWNWQFSYFEEHLTNLRVREYEHPDASIHDLYYAIKDENNDNETTNNSNKPKPRVYTISLESDEYRDIRMTYMHCPGMQTFRCLSYPRNGDLPIMGMGIMKMGGSKNLAILDYQPLPPTDEKEVKINDTYTAELLKLRQEIPSFSQPMTRRHFDSSEERKYFTEFPLLGRCNELEVTSDEKAQYRNNLSETQQKYVAKHVELTQKFAKKGHLSAEKELDSYVLQRHSDFDTHVCEKEPAGPFLCGVFGPEKGGRLVHNVIFPLSRHGLSGFSPAETEE